MNFENEGLSFPGKDPASLSTASRSTRQIQTFFYLETVFGAKVIFDQILNFF